MPTVSHSVVDMFEKEMAKYTGAKYAIAVESCSAALFLCCVYLKVKTITIPKHTYFSVPCSIIHAGGKVKFTDYTWSGVYQLAPYPIFDSALYFAENMCKKNADEYICLSFHTKKILNIGRGGMILCNNKKANDWFRSARWDGRNNLPMNKEDIKIAGWNMYMTPEQAARGLHLLETFKDNYTEKTIKNEYPDLSKFKVYTK